MVSDPPRKEVNVTRMIIYSLVPFLNIYAGWRIQKFRRLLVLDIVLGLVTYPLDNVMGYSFAWIISLAITIFIPLYFVNKYAHDYNEKIKNPEFSY